MVYQAFLFNKNAFKTFGNSYKVKLVSSVALLTGGQFLYQSSYKPAIQNSIEPYSENSVSVDRSIKDIDTFLTFQNGSAWSLLAYGVRAVTFMKFRIYALSIYSNAQTIEKLDQFFTGNSIQKVDLEESVIVNLLEKKDLEFLARITPLRNTTYEHLREGMIRSAMSSTEAKLEPEAMVKAVQIFRQDGMQRGGSVVVNDDLFLLKNKDNTLTIYHFDNKLQTYTVVGNCNHPLFAIALFSKYLNYDSPLTSEAQQRFSNFFKL
ncbi:hypothetical protein QEN19_002611 [Hanseniaspora menglaensis]